jgi:hypothetical protein
MARSSLVADVDSAKALDSMHAVVVDTSWIDSPQSLQEKIWRIFDPSRAGHSRGSERQVH